MRQDGVRAQVSAKSKAFKIAAKAVERVLPMDIRQTADGVSLRPLFGQRFLNKKYILSKNLLVRG